MSEATLTKRHKHDIVKKCSKSTKVSGETIEEMIKKLSEIDSSNWLEQTRNYVQAAPKDIAVKRERWAYFFSKECSLNYDNGIQQFQGFMSYKSDLALMQEFYDDFFNKMIPTFKSKSKYVAENYFNILSPAFLATDEIEKKFKNLKDEVEKNHSDLTSLLENLNQTIDQISFRKAGRKLSQNYIDENW